MATIKVVLYTAAWDTGGQGYRIKQAFDRYYPEEFSVRSIHTSDNYFRFPKDLTYSPPAAYELFAGADVIHMRNGLEGLKRLRPDAFEGKVGLVCHWHGTKFREEHARLAPEVAETGAIQLVSTLDLAGLAPNLVWCPSPVDIGALKAIAEPIQALRKLIEPIRVAHAPTNRVVKSTLAIMDAVQALNSDIGLPIVLDLIEKKPWAEVLIRKAHADLLVDQLKLGYGNNSLEAWAMGIPVIAGVSDQLTRSRMLEKFGFLPFYEAAEVNIEKKIADLATDPALRAHWGAIGFDFVSKFHDDRVVADLLAGVYRRAARRES